MTTGILNPQEISTVLEYNDRYLNTIVYSDIDLKFTPHPITGDISINEDLNAIKKALQYLLLTKLGERPFQPNFGSTIANQLFEPVEIDYISIAEAIRRTVSINEPRIKIEDVIIIDNPDMVSNNHTYHASLMDDSNSIDISIFFKVKHFKETVKLTLNLKRTR